MADISNLADKDGSASTTDEENVQKRQRSHRQRARRALKQADLAQRQAKYYANEEISLGAKRLHLKKELIAQKTTPKATQISLSVSTPSTSTKKPQSAKPSAIEPHALDKGKTVAEPTTPLKTFEITTLNERLNQLVSASAKKGAQGSVKKTK